MTTKTVGVGAPSLTGKGANALVDEAFSGVAFPTHVTFANHMPRDCSLAEVGVFLNHVAGGTNTSTTVNVDSLDLLHRVASSIEAIADLNHFPHALSISIEVAEPEAHRSKPSKNHAGDAPTVALKGIGTGASETATVVDGVITSIAIKNPAGDV